MIHLKQTNKKLLWSILIILLSLPLISCQNDDDISEPEESPATSRFWKSPTSGYVLEIREDGTINQFGSTSLGCVQIVQDLDLTNFANLSINQISETELTLSSPLVTGEISFNLLTSEEQECATVNLISSTDPATNYRHFWTIFNEYYSSFEHRNIDWSIYEDAENQATEDNLYELIAAAVEPLNDGHVSIFNDTVDISSSLDDLINRLNEFLDPSDQVTDFNEINTLFEAKQQTIITNYLDANVGLGSDAGGNIFYGLLTEDIGYINIYSMAGYSSDLTTEIDALDTAMEEVFQAIDQFGVDKIVMDIRFNGGGFDGVALSIASRFFDQERTVFTKVSRMGDGFGDEAVISVSPDTNGTFTGDIVLLTGPFTASASEIFTLAMNTLPHVTIVGQNTNGAFSDILTHKLPNGTYINLSNQIYTDPNGINFEGIGIGPDLENVVPFFSSSDFENDTDSGIDRALELLE